MQFIIHLFYISLFLYLFTYLPLYLCVRKISRKNCIFLTKNRTFLRNGVIGIADSEFKIAIFGFLGFLTKKWEKWLCEPLFVKT